MRRSNTRAAAGRDPPHRVRDVPVEAGEETEAVLGRQVGAAAGGGAGHGQAARLAAGDVARLEDDDLEAALGELVGGGQAGDAAAEDRDPRHAPTLSDHSTVSVPFIVSLWLPTGQ